MTYRVILRNQLRNILQNLINTLIIPKKRREKGNTRWLILLLCELVVQRIIPILNWWTNKPEALPQFDLGNAKSLFGSVAAVVFFFKYKYSCLVIKNCGILFIEFYFFSALEMQYLQSKNCLLFLYYSHNCTI